MLCRNPFLKGMHAFPCGQCMPCRFNRRRMWTHRIMLEALQHSDNAFVNLTYSDDHLPKDGSVVPLDLQNWLKRFRKSIAPVRVRYYAVGEYGDDSWRPHYHVALFGFPTCLYGNSRRMDRCCSRCDAVRNSWGLGGVMLGTLEQSSASYIAGYVTKKMTRFDDDRLGSRHPEFCRMSLRPGIGADAMYEVASQLLKFNLDTSQPDVPSALRHGSRTLPLGRYLRQRLRALIGKDVSAPQAVLDALASDLQPLLDIAKASAPKGGEYRQTVLKNLLIDEGEASVISMEARAKIFKGRRSL